VAELTGACNVYPIFVTTKGNKVMKKFGKLFYSNSKEFLAGVIAGAEYVNDGPIKIGEISQSDLSQFQFMVLLEDEDADELTVEHF
jgi:hypothetical protein